MDDIQKQLSEDVEPQYITTRGEGKNALDYVTGRYVKQRLNEIFGWDGWSYEVVEQKLVTLDDHCVRWFAHVRLTVFTNPANDGITRDGMAVGHGLLEKEKWEQRDGRWRKTGQWEPVTPGRANEVVDFAAAEAVTDALKRAAVSLGQNLGMSLYPIAKGKKEDPGHTEPVPLPEPPKAEPEPTDTPDVYGMARRMGEAKTPNELAELAAELAKLNLTEKDRTMLASIYQTAKGRLSK